MTIWGPAFDAEIEYRRQALSAAAVGRRARRRGSRGRRASSASASGRTAARAAGAPALGTPVVAGFTVAAASRR